jgi:hypothetical protein
MIGLPAGRCRSCDAPVSHFARTCPECHAANLPNPVAIGAALGAVALLGCMVALGVHLFRGSAAPPEASQSTPEGATPQAAVPATRPGSGPAVDPKEDYGWIVQAMADCDEEAKQKQDTLRFLIVPLTTTGVSLPGWSPNPITTVGNVGALLNSTDALIGLRNRVFALYPKPLTFAVSDPVGKTVFKWKPAVGVSALTSRDTGLASLTVGFEIPDLTKEVEWGPVITLKKGNCYWINPLIRAGARGAQ